MTCSQRIIDSVQFVEAIAPKEIAAGRASARRSVADQLGSIPGDLYQGLSKGFHDLSKELGRAPGEIGKGLDSLMNQLRDEYEQAHPAVRGLLRGLGATILMELIETGLKLGTKAGRRVAERIAANGIKKLLFKANLVITAVDILNAMLEELREASFREREFERVARDAVTREIYGGREPREIGLGLDYSFDSGDSSFDLGGDTPNNSGGPSLGNEYDFGDMPDFEPTVEFDGGNDDGGSEGGDGDGGSEGCFIATACIQAVGTAGDNFVLTMLQRLRDLHLNLFPAGRDVVKNYYRDAPSLVAKINSQPEALDLWRLAHERLTEIGEAIQRGRYKAATIRYAALMNELKALCAQDVST